MPKQLMLYLPVIHSGYERLLARHGDGEVLLIGGSFAEAYPVIRKEIRALAPERAAEYVRVAHPSARIRVVEQTDLPDAVAGPILVLPDEKLMRDIARTYRLDERATLRYERTFLRWDRKWSRPGRPVNFQGNVTLDQLAQTFTTRALHVGARSSDWWRQVGAVAVRDGAILDEAYNEHAPSEYAPYLNGDPRNDFSRGVRPDLTTALHAEAAIVARAARTGSSLAGADLFVSTFPCPTCARLIAAAGFARCFFAGAYSVLEGERVLSDAGVELYFVDVAGADGEQLSFADLSGAAALGYE